MLGNVLVTKQTGPEGRLVSKLIIAAAPDIQKELYLAVLLDRSSSRPVVMASTEGGMDIEEVAAKTPEKIVKETIDPALGMMPYQARKVAAALGLKGNLMGQATKFLLGVYSTWWESDASLVEINPLCITRTREGKTTLLAVDAKISLDDNALYRHPNLQAMRDLAEEAPLETRGQQVQPELYQARRQYCLPGQWRRPGHGHHGHHPALRWPPRQLPRRRRRRQPGASRRGVSGSSSRTRT